MSFYSRLPQKPKLIQRLKQWFSKVYPWILGIVITAICLGLTALLATGAWKGLVALITAIIEAGPAAIISALISGYFVYTCVLPVVVLLAAISVIVWMRS